MNLDEVPLEYRAAVEAAYMDQCAWGRIPDYVRSFVERQRRVERRNARTKNNETESR